MDSNPGILPFKLGNAKIRSTSHTFIHYFELKPIEDELILITKQLNDIQTVNIKDKRYSTRIKTMQALISHQLNLAKEMFSSLHQFPSNRKRRGVFNGLGTVFKSITGNLDSEDGKRFDEAISMLKSNQNNIASTLNKQISLTTRIIENYNKTLNLIKQNENRLAAKINDIMKTATISIDDFLQARNALEEISSVINIISQTLSNLVNAVTFARLKLLHNSILTHKDIEYMIEKILEHYSANELFFGSEISNTHRYYELLDVEAYYSNYKVVFIIHFPLMHPETYSFYHLYPIPNKHQEILIPSKPYLAMNSRNYYFNEDECTKVHTMFHCKDVKPFEQQNNDDCIHEILQLKTNHSTSCEFVPITIKSEIIEEITASHYIGIFPVDTKLHLKCESTDFTTVKGTFLIELPTNCSFQTVQNSYSNNEDFIAAQPLLLPALKIPGTSTNNSNQIVLDDIPLDKIHKIYKEQQNIQAISLRNTNTSTNYTWVLITCCIALIAVLMTTKYYTNFKNCILKPQIVCNQPNQQPTAHQIQPNQQSTAQQTHSSIEIIDE